MSQPEISPLARRLAEENNVNWRGLHGSGAGGKVVERDVLEYLARVMAGEEDLDPTPEPVPEGMESWPEEDVRAFQSDMRASNMGVGLHQIQQELSASDRLGQGVDGVGSQAARERAWPAELADEEPILEAGDGDEAEIREPLAGEPVAGEPAFGEPEASDDISEDIFLFEDEEEGGEPLGEGAYGGFTPSSVEAAETSVPADDELLVEGEERVSWEDGFNEPGSGDDGLWAGASAGRSADDLPDVFGGDVQTSEPVQDGSDLFGEADTEPEAPMMGELEVPPLGDLETEEPAAVEPPAEVWGSDEAAAGAVDSEGEPWESGGAFEEAAFEETTVEEEGIDESLGAADGAAFEEPTPPPSPAWSDHAGMETQPAATPDVDDMGVAPVTDFGPPPSELPLVSYGTLLRRHVDVTALAGAQLAVGLELGEREPLAPAPFLLRAAAKAVAEESWGNGTVAMVALEGVAGMRLVRVDEAGSRPFVELVGTLGGWSDQIPQGAEGAALAVADMSALDVDEAVLNLGAPLLTLGRILYDNQRGSYRSTLSLSGDVVPEQGARLLARVAELLDAPVRLLL